MPLPAAAFPLRVSGPAILGADGVPVRLAGVNWGGAQQDELLPYGLDKLHRSRIIARITGWGLNHVRFPFALGTFVTNSGTPKTGAAKASRLAANPDLTGKTPWQVYCQLVDDMTAAGLYVILNQHLLHEGWCCADADSNGFWFNDNWPSAAFTNVWVMLAERFAANPRVGYDLHNEPRKATIGGAVRTPTWGDGNTATDMRRMYQATASRIRAADPGALIFCEGLNYAADLTGWAAHPVTGSGIVASAHDYPWFHRHPDGTPQTRDEYFAQNDARFGYLTQRGTAPVWIGECGTGTDASLPSLRGGWLPNFLAYAAARPVHWCWWELGATTVLGTQPATNAVKMQPGQREGFGLMAGQDWQGSQADVLAMLAPVMT